MIQSHDLSLPRSNHIHLYAINLSSYLTELKERLTHLSGEERKHAERLPQNHLYQRYVVQRSFLRETIGHYLKVNPQDIEFQYSKHGKPAIVASTDGLSFNISHSEDVLVMAFGQNLSLGIDVEKLKLKLLEKIVRRFFSKSEAQAYFSATEIQKMEVFYNCWTGKEAYLKARGDGISLDLSSFSIESRLHLPPQLTSFWGDDKEISQWKFYRFKPCKGFIATLVYPSIEVELKLYSFPPNPAL